MDGAAQLSSAMRWQRQSGSVSGVGQSVGGWRVREQAAEGRAGFRGDGGGGIMMGWRVREQGEGWGRVWYDEGGEWEGVGGRGMVSGV